MGWLNVTSKRKRKVLYLFSGGGGAGYGYYLAGCEVTGVDVADMPGYPFEFIQHDALSFPLDGYDLIHASPPCQAYSDAAAPYRTAGKEYPDLIEVMRARLVASGIPYVIENVVGAPLIDPVMLCGTMFGLKVYRHRLFEASFPIGQPAHPAHLWNAVKTRWDASPGHIRPSMRIYGNDDSRQAMGISWMTGAELKQAVPPAYTRFIAEEGRGALPGPRGHRLRGESAAAGDSQTGGDVTIAENEKDCEPLDGDAVLGTLTDFWACPQPSRFTGKVPDRIAGSEWDQPVPDGIENPYWEVVRQLPLDDMASPSPWRTRPEPNMYLFTDDPSGSGFRLFANRYALCGTYSWSVCSPGDIAWIKDLLGGMGVVEAGAGGGYWAWQLRQAGVDVAAYDPAVPGEHYFARREWSPILPGDASAVGKHPDRALFLCRSSYGEPWAAEALTCYQGDLLIYAGEGEGGCTAGDGFFELLGAGWEEAGVSPSHISYSGINCDLTAYRRKGAT